MISPSLMEKQKYLKSELDVVQKAILDEVSKLDLQSKISFALTHPVLLVSLLSSDVYYTGTADISLYDDLHWERHETRTIDDLIEHTLDDIEEEEDELEYILKSDNPRAVVIRDMLKSNIGTATFDW